MKPDWLDAPEFAQYLAMDKNGSWSWFEFEPKLVGVMWCSRGQWRYVSEDLDYKESMEKRP